MRTFQNPRRFGVPLLLTGTMLATAFLVAPRAIAADDKPPPARAVSSVGHFAGWHTTVRSVRATRGNRPSVPAHHRGHRPIRAHAFVVPPLIGNCADNYCSGDAATYADNNYNRRNSNYPTYSNDCANFVSQVLEHGGVPYTSVGGSGATAWWSTPTISSQTWHSTAPLDAYLDWRVPVGTSWEGTKSYPHTSDLYFKDGVVNKGDPLFYNWYGPYDYNPNHASVMIGRGYDATYPSWSGNYVDQHTTDRYHAFWSLWPYNPDRVTTTVSAYHLGA